MDTFNLPVIISNCSNNYGPYQYPEKLIPLFILNIMNKETLTVYSKGDNIRDWLYVIDHVQAIDLIFQKSEIGKTYNIGGNNEWKNIDLINHLIEIVDKELGRENGDSLNLIKFVKDRPGHDLRYAIDTSKIKKELNWEPKYDFKEGLINTVKWYLNNLEWVKNLKK